MRFVYDFQRFEISKPFFIFWLANFGWKLNMNHVCVYYWRKFITIDGYRIFDLVFPHRLKATQSGHCTGDALDGWTQVSLALPGKAMLKGLRANAERLMTNTQHQTWGQESTRVQWYVRRLKCTSTDNTTLHTTYYEHLKPDKWQVCQKGLCHKAPWHYDSSMLL